MKWLTGCLLALCIVSSAFAGEDPYVAIVGNDILCQSAPANFYISTKQQQFCFDQTIFGVPTAQETFISQSAAIQPEICDFSGTGVLPGSTTPTRDGFLPPFTYRGTAQARVTAGNAGFWQWVIRLPKKPSGEINLVFECGVLKPNGFTDKGFFAVETCAAETGERIGAGFCTRQPVDPGTNPVISAALPKVIAFASPGPYNSFTPFFLTAFRNPGTYNPAFNAAGAILEPADAAAAPVELAATQVLTGGLGSRILLKTCFDKVVVAKLPVAGQVNATAPVPVGFTNVEADLVDGDLITVRLNLPRQNTVDVYCGVDSLRLDGVGESPF